MLCCPDIWVFTCVFFKARVTLTIAEAVVIRESKTWSIAYCKVTVELLGGSAGQVWLKIFVYSIFKQLGASGIKIELEAPFRSEQAQVLSISWAVPRQAVHVPGQEFKLFISHLVHMPNLPASQNWHCPSAFRKEMLVSH